MERIEGASLLDSTTRGAGYDEMGIGGIRYVCVHGLPACDLCGVRWTDLLLTAWTCTVSFVPGTLSPKHPKTWTSTVGRQCAACLPYGTSMDRRLCASTRRDPDVRGGEQARQARHSLTFYFAVPWSGFTPLPRRHLGACELQVASRKGKAGRRTGPRLLMQAVESVATH